MNASDFYAVAYDGAIYCVSCCPEPISGNPDVYPVFACSEWDHYPTCDACHAEHDYVNLTTDGYKWRQRREWSARMKDFGQECDDHRLDIPSFTPFGSYTLIYIDKEGNEYCGNCANNRELTLSLQGFQTYDEGPTIQCTECNDDIESSYGEVEND